MDAPTKTQIETQMETQMETDVEEKVKLPYVRTPEDVNEIIRHARLDQRSLTPVTQAFYYPPSRQGYENWRLLELDSHMFSKIRGGKSLQFKGGLHETVVLCTDEKTYEVKEAEISNSLLLVPELKFAAETSTSPLKSPRVGPNASLDRSNEDDSDDEVTIERVLEQKKVLKIFYEYLECKEIQPRFRKLCDLLMMTRYSGPENEYLIEKKLLFTYNQLLDTVQCSKKQFEEGLKQFRVIEHCGHMRILEYEYEYRIVNVMMGLITENSWALDEIQRDETIAALQGIAPSEIVEAIFDIYAQPVEEKPGKFMYQGKLLARIVALNILQPGLKFRVDEFMSTWQDALIEGIKADKKYLRGIGIIDLDSKPPCIRSLNEENITTNILDRIELLFKLKAKWTFDEIEPYLEYFTTPTVNVSLILTKHTRSFLEGGVRQFVAKHL